MSPENVALAREIVLENVTSARMFTAFEVSLEVQNRAKQQGVLPERHRDMKSDIHDAITEHSVLSGGNYIRTLMDVGAEDQAWVYHPQGTDATTTYKPLDRSGHGTAVPPVVTAHASPKSVVPDGAHKIDSGGRICFPVSMVKKLGLEAEDNCMVTFGTQGQVSLKKTAATDPATNTPYSVDEYGNVRVSRFTLRKAGLEGTELFKFTESADEVVASPF